MALDLFDLSGKVAVVTGGGTGIGLGIAMGLAQSGAQVTVVGRRQEVIDQAVVEIRGRGGKAEGVSLDITHMKELPAFFEAIRGRHRRLDILVNSAGTNCRNSALNYTEEEWDTVMDLNLKAVFFCCQAAARIMKEQGEGGKIINIGSLASVVTMLNQSAYAPSKAGIMLLTKQLALELAPYKINVNSIGPGWFRTPLSHDMFRNEAWARGVLSMIPMARIGLPEDLFGIAIFLASRASDYLTGQTIYIDGGMMAGYKVRPIPPEEV